MEVYKGLQESYKHMQEINVVKIHSLLVITSEVATLQQESEAEQPTSGKAPQVSQS